ncbi:MAG: 2-oxoisovalerate dehydrogenase [Deltaproteobacteria bacterium]|nr:2-oxoisovalerate dehydrogenase [Deltaproteobacteria bacterium]
MVATENTKSADKPAHAAHAELPPLKVKAYKATAQEVRHWYRLMFLTRQLEDRASKFIRLGKGWSYLARCAGHEGIQVALGLAFRANKDFLFPYYRDMATTVAAGLTPLEIVLNGLSKAADVCSGGRGMSNHFGKPAIGIQNVSSCTGNHASQAAGLARAVKYYKSDAVVFSSQGESSASEGYVFEALNGASRERVPAIFVLQANGYGISVPTSDQTANEVVAENFRGLKGLKLVMCDGTDIFDSTRAMHDAVEHVRRGGGPVVINAACVRMGAHSNSDAHELYRSPEEIKDAERYDPLARLRATALSHGFADDKALREIEAEVLAEVEQACAQGEASAEPDPATVLQFNVPEPYAPAALDAPRDGGKEEKLREAITRTMLEEFRRNPDTFLWGQDVASKDKGGVFNLTKGMQAEFGPGRVFNGPIAENYIVATANGMCRYDPKIHVVIEAAQFADYVWPAMEQVVEISHEYWRTNGQFVPNVVCRLASGGYIGGGPYHSQNVEGILGTLPGVRVIAPAFADDAAGLLRTAVRSRGVTFFLEPKYLYNRPEARGPNLGPDHCIPLGQARVRREGTDVSVVTYGNTVHFALEAAKALEPEGISVEVVDLRCVRPLDEAAILATVKKTGKLLVLHEDRLFGGLGGEVAALAAEKAFEFLDAPVRRLASKDAAGVAFNRILENATLVQPQQVVAALRDLARY